MSTISTGVGLISGIDIAGVVDALINAQRGTVLRLQSRATVFEQTSDAVKSLESDVLSISTAVQDLGRAETFSSFRVDVSDSSVLDVSATNDAVPGRYVLKAVRDAATQQVLSKGFANADQQAIGAGTLVISTTGFLHRSTPLDMLNGGNGVRRGRIRITDRSGQSADIDLTNAYSVDDVLRAINQNTSISVTATTDQGRIVLIDQSGSTASALSVVDLDGGYAAEDLGIRQSVAADTLTGASVYQLTGDFGLDLINDGNRLYRVQGAPDLRITLTDDTVLDVLLDDAVTLNDVVEAINGHPDNNGKLQAALVDGRLELTDLSGGGGTSAFSVQDINGSVVVRQLGLDVSATGNVISGRRLLAGINSVLLRNLRGGRGITQQGQISLTDRAGTTAVVDLSNAESLDEVLYAINTATSSGGTKLQLVAQIDSAGTGIEIRDTSGATASNLVIADVGGSTLAAELGIAVNAPQNSVASGPLGQRGINEATSLEDYAPDGGGIAEGSILITDSAGNQEAIYFSSAVQTIGDVLMRINAAQNVAVRAELNETGDGFVLIDQAGGSGTLRVEEVDSTTAADLRILGQAAVVNGSQQIVSRRATIVEIGATDTLNDVVQKINDAGSDVTASVVNDGSAFNSYRLVLQSNRSGVTGRFAVDSGNLSLGFQTSVQAQDALLRVGENPASAFMLASNTNRFDGALPGLDVELLKTSDATVEVDVSRDNSSIKDALQRFVDNYNAFYDSAADYSKFDPETNERGILQGSGFLLRVTTRLQNAIGRRLLGPNDAVRSLADLGVRVTDAGRLELDTERLDKLLAENFQAVSKFFLEADTGFADQMQNTLDTLTDSFTGAFALEENSLQESVDSLNDRIQQLEAVLEMRRERLMRQFLAMEEILASLQDQQNALLQMSRATSSNRR
ncbi:MAG: flagellar filament capping protein FliD [Planctomycetes bacterium]|nr:flagellar filament capping protein FliD [Planctomycetota bacterium]